MQRSSSVGLETPSILAEMVTVPALDDIRQAVRQAKRMGLLQLVLLIEVLDITRRRRVGELVTAAPGGALEAEPGSGEGGRWAPR